MRGEQQLCIALVGTVQESGELLLVSYNKACVVCVCVWRNTIVKHALCGLVCVSKDIDSWWVCLLMCVSGGCSVLKQVCACVVAGI